MADKGYLHRRAETFGKLPEALMHDTTITDGACRLYSHMHWRYGSNGDNHEGRASMADTLGVSATTISNRTAELVAKDWIVVLVRTNANGRTTNVYHVFEVQEDCRKWRESHNQPKPEVQAKARKTRQGVGGKPSHKKVSKSTQVDEPSELKLTNLVNLSSQNLDSVIQTQDPDSTLLAKPAKAASPTEQVEKPALKSTPAKGKPNRTYYVALDNGTFQGPMTLQTARKKAGRVVQEESLPPLAQIVSANTQPPLTALQKVIGSTIFKLSKLETMDANRANINRIQRHLLTIEGYAEKQMPTVEESDRLAADFRDKFLPWYKVECEKRFKRQLDNPSGDDTFPKWYGEWFDLDKPGKVKLTVVSKGDTKCKKCWGTGTVSKRDERGRDVQVPCECRRANVQSK